jgi:hypothetical protein
LHELDAQLHQAIESNNLLFFVGSGLSRSLGLPDWKQLIANLITYVPQEDKRSALKSAFDTEILNVMDVLDRIDNYTKALSRKAIYSGLIKQFELTDNKHPALDIYRMLWSISSKIVTTNYDNALLITNPNAKLIHVDDDFYLSDITKLNNFIFHLHGSVKRPDRIVLFEDTYKQLYEEKKFQAGIHALSSLLSKYTVVFVGFSLSDEYVRKQLKYIRSIYGEFSNTHFFISTKDDDFSSYGVQTINIDNWDNLPGFLEAMNSSTTRASLAATASTSSVAPIRTYTSPQLDEINIAILITEPLDHTFKYNVEKTLRLFKKYDVNITLFHLSIDKLQSLDGFNYVFIFTKTFRHKLIVEDSNLSSKYISLKKLEDNVPDDNLQGLFIFVDKRPQLDESYNLPIVVVEETKGSLEAILFKAFKKCDLSTIEGCHFFRREKLELVKLPSGSARINRPNVSARIDTKSLKNFVGREDDVHNICRRILELNGQILNIKGSGGIGKTTTVKRAAEELIQRGRFQDGVYFIDCGSVDGFQSLEHEVAHCFGIDSSLNLVEHLQQNEIFLNALIILDNFETCIANCPRNSLENLLWVLCEHSCVVLTSRDRLSFDFEKVLEFRSLTTEEALELFQRLFHRISNEEELKILRNDILEDLLNNNPLAIKLITGNTPKSKGIRELKIDLNNDFFSTTTEFREIYGGPVDTNIERSRSLYNSINYSYRQLSSREQLAFDLLSLFPNGIYLENFKVFLNLAENDIKGLQHRITERDLKVLEDKSLVESSYGVLKLQAIIGRFAARKLRDREKETLLPYYKQAFSYHTFLLDMIREKNKRESMKAVTLFENLAQNFHRSLSYLNDAPVEDEEKLEYLHHLTQFFIIIEMLDEFAKALKDLELNVKTAQHGKLLIQVLLLKVEYYAGAFESAYHQLRSLVSFNDIRSFDANEKVQSLIIRNALQIYIYEGMAYEALRYYRETEHSDWFWTIGYLIFLHLGLFTIYAKLEIGEKGFPDFDIEFNMGLLEADELNRYIDSIPDNTSIDKMQNMYIKAKITKLEAKEIKPLVVTNPFTRGLKNLMFAFAEENQAKAKELYLNAIKDLTHIKYYYIEAMYYLCHLLKNSGDEEYGEYISESIELARKYKYRNLLHRLICLDKGNNVPYVEEEYPFDEPIDLEHYVELHNDWFKREIAGRSVNRTRIERS